MLKVSNHLRQVTFLLSLACLSSVVGNSSEFGAEQPAPLSLLLKTDLSLQILSEVCTGKPIDEFEIRRSKPILAMLTHFSQFRDYFTMDTYILARKQAANCEKSSRNIYRFNEVIDHKDSLLDQLRSIKENQQSLSINMTNIVSPYTPDGLSYSGTATVMIGTPSCGGWAKGRDFYLDLPCIKGDEQGMLYLIAHESYHGIQNEFFADRPKKDGPAKLLDAIVREGSATAIADFSTLPAGGYYTDLSQRILQKNSRRVQSNFDLLDLAILYLTRKNQAGAYEKVNSIGLSGSFDSPFYSVGVTIFKAVDQKLPRAKLLCILHSDPAAIFSLYASFQKQDDTLPQLGPALLGYLSTRPLKMTACETIESDP
ncbi:hypothetical protein QGN29_06690 [Temperatibacter marinus]|uniref:Uncharacterized protein n=1 Tax=Temperatibacter marinus TaxID=1456591 RepID=A0AA52EJQ2_9PROT|nr:DUF5700 domain-containing putative Zn-dependent protease [Temperatibacter marinus]WND04060.1 hypothetical protein QGN29_06690 [Temperatibacter marinus]